MQVKSPGYCAGAVGTPFAFFWLPKYLRMRVSAWVETPNSVGVNGWVW